MDRHDSNQIKILSAVGLTNHMTRLGITGFQSYTPSKYEGSELQDRDAMHRMSEIVLLHMATGLRFSYLETESYDGETADYKILGIEVIAIEGQEYKVVDVDFERQVVITEHDQIPFLDLSKKPN